MRKLVVGLGFVAAGILVTTRSIGTVDHAPSRVASAAPLAAPVFFFDDAADALTEHGGGAATGIKSTASRAPSPLGLIRTVARARSDASEPSAPPSRPSGQPGPSPGSVGADGSPAPPETHSLGSEASAPPSEHDTLDVPPGAVVSHVVVAAGDTLSGILNRYGVRMEQIPALLDDDIVESDLANLRIGQGFDIARLADGSFQSLEAKVGDDRRITIGRDGDALAVTSTDLPLERERVVTSGTIEESLYIAAEQADLKQSTIMALANIFQWELDFARDIRKGDHFALVYDRLYREGRYIGDGDILAAEFERGGRTYLAIGFTAADGHSGYYSPDGTSKRRTFLRHPVDDVRITSKFSLGRLHPVLHKIRPHLGVDYGAPFGSPIHATADGTVKFSGKQNAYGNVVILQHGERISTLYAHMSKISDKTKVGRRVRQGDVIGYVGNSGRVTGTHLHYEFRVDGEHVDPLTVELPAAAPLPPDQLDAFHAKADELIGQMHGARPHGDAATLQASVPTAPDAASGTAVASVLGIASLRDKGGTTRRVDAGSPVER